jgi:hypothetical protein
MLWKTVKSTYMACNTSFTDPFIPKDKPCNQGALYDSINPVRDGDCTGWCYKACNR